MLSSSLQRRQKVLDSGPSRSPGAGKPWLSCPGGAPHRNWGWWGAEGSLPAQGPPEEGVEGVRLLSGERRAQGSWVASAFSSSEPRGVWG